MTCPRCGEGVVSGQEYCLECGLRLPGPGRLGPPPLERRALLLPLAGLGALALAGAALAIGVTRDPTTQDRIVTATGGSITEPAPLATESGLAFWPRGRDGWTIVLVSVPKAEGRDAAVAEAENARRRKLPRVGIIDSSRFASLHPGYWIVFTGVYDSEPEAAGALQAAKAVQRAARTQRIAR